MVGRTFATTRRWLRASLDQLTAGQQWTIVAILGLVVALLGAGAPDQGSASTAEVPSPAAFAPRPIEGALSATLPPGPVVAPAPAFGEPVDNAAFAPTTTTTTTTTAPPPPPTTTTTEPPPPSDPAEPPPLPVPLPLP